MPDEHSIPPHMRTVDEPEITRKQAALWYVFLFLMVELSLLAWTLLAATRSWFPYHIGYPAMSMMGYSERARGTACQILIYGDSTALVGIDPAILQAETGLKTCNIAEYRPVQDFVGVDFPLDEYLKSNPTPRFLVTSWLPSNFQLEHPLMRSFRTEGFIYALQYDRGLWLWSGLLHHPAKTLNFLTWAETSESEDIVSRIMHRHDSTLFVDERAKRDSQAGMWAFTDPPEKKCGLADVASLSDRAENIVGVAAFRRRYTTKGMQVIVNVSPIADCSDNIPKFRELTDGMADNSLELLPIRYFNTLNVHLDREGSLLYTSQVADQITTRMHKSQRVATQ